MNNEYVERSYRRSFGSDLHYFRVNIAQSDLMIGAQRPLKEEALTLLKQARENVLAEIAKLPAFETSLVPLPYTIRHNAPASWMYTAGEAAAVGPMAAVAGAIARYVGEGLLKHSSEVLVENGGDLFIASAVPRRAAIFAGESPFSMKIAVEVPAGVHGLCTSAGKIGPSYSKGNADAAVVLSRDAALADAAATALGNLLKTDQKMTYALKAICATPGVQGAIAILGDQIGLYGDIQLVRL